MSYTIIDKKTDNHTYGHWPVAETVTTTISLLNLGGSKLGLSYESSFSGIKKGDVHGGPIAVSGDLNQVVNASPEVRVIVSNFQNSGAHASMHVTITVHIPVLGTQTIYSETLGGQYTNSTGWTPAITSLDLRAAQQSVAT